MKLGIPITQALVVAWGLASCSPSDPGLQFDALSVHREVKAGQPEMRSSFTFRNASSQRIHIRKIETSCGCLRAEADKEVYAPGEPGTIQADFSLLGYTGDLEKTVTVITDHPRHRETRLTVNVKVPPLMELEPDRLAWAIGDAPEAKSATLRILRSAPIQITGVDSTRNEMHVSVETIEEGKVYRFKLQPNSTQETMIGAVRIDLDCEIPEQRRRMLFFQIDHQETLEQQDDENF